mgnify:CR=1 FL=1
MLRPTAEQLATLGRFEHIAFEIADQVNRNPTLKRMSHAFLRTVQEAWMGKTIGHLLHTEGEELLRGLDPDRGVMLVANHRSFFDFYAISVVLMRSARWVERLYFPVRSTFFYERVAGVLVNAAMSGMSMYPPVMRDASKRPFNQYAVDVLVDLVRDRGSVVGFHPEGTRNKGDDPYTLLPANIGAGTVAHHARPIVLPVFTLGLLNSLPRQVMNNFNGEGVPVTVVIGKPLDLDAYYQRPARLRTYKAIADAMRDGLMRLGEQERSLRARLGLQSMAPAMAFG